jgi:alginate O-acetyltransferase complex protein AlgI
MRFCIWLVLAVLGAATLGEIFAPYRAPLLETVWSRTAGAMGDDHTRPAAGLIGESTLRLRTMSDHYALGGTLTIEASGGVLFASMLNRDGPIPLGPGHPRCSAFSDANGHWSCRIPFRFEGVGWIDVASAMGAPELHRFDAVVIKASPLAATGLGSLMMLFAALSAMALLQLIMPAPIDAAVRSRWLAAIGAAWLVASGGAGALVLAAFVGGLYVLLRLQVRAPGSRGVFAAALGFVIIAVLLSRLAIPWSWRAFADPGSLALAIPLGFAFMIIRAADLTLRVATREVRDLPLRDYAAYMLFPPTLAAGPIMTLPQFTAAAIVRPGIVDWSAGAARIGVGLAKKVAADILLTRIAAPKLALLYTDTVAIAPDDLAVLLFANALYVYLDFSAYSDVAIGVGRQLGWRVPENFEFPLLRTNMRSFWQSWHMTLSGWVSRWIHFFCSFNLRQTPAGVRVAVPVIVSLLVIGLWHELQWVWLLWGLHHALGILLGDAWRAMVFRWAPVARGAVTPLLQIGGMVFVWSWVALSQCFTLMSDPVLALAVYVRITPWGW